MTTSTAEASTRGPAGTSLATHWERGRLDARSGPKRILFGRMYEDPAIEQTVFPRGGRIFCIASAGCTALALCDRHDTIVACDINPTQLAYAERRIRDGADMEVGSAERLMGIARVFMPLAGWSKRRLREFFELADPSEQIRFWRERLDTWRFRLGFGALTSLTALKAFYSSELLDCLPTNLGTVLRHRMERTFAEHPNADNPYARALFLGDAARAATPSMSDRAKIELVLSDAATYLEDAPPRSFHGLTFSNILDGATASYRDRLHAAIKHAAAPDAVVVMRSFAEPQSPHKDHARLDRSMLWGVVDVRRVSEL